MSRNITDEKVKSEPEYTFYNVNSTRASELRNYKENLLQNIRYTAKQVGGLVRVQGSGDNRRVQLTKDGRYCAVWFPEDSRVKSIEITDLKDACEYIFGVKPFSI